MHRYLHKEDNSIKIFEFRIYILCIFACAIIITFKCISLQFTWFFSCTFSQAVCCIQFAPLHKEPHSTFFKKRYQKQIKTLTHKKK